MSTLYVMESDRVASGDNGHAIQALAEPSLAEYVIAIGAISAKHTSKIHKDTRVIMIHTDAICHVNISVEGVATTSNRRLPADSTVFCGIKPEYAGKLTISVIQGT